MYILFGDIDPTNISEEDELKQKTRRHHFIKMLKRYRKVCLIHNWPKYIENIFESNILNLLAEVTYKCKYNLYLMICNADESKKILINKGNIKIKKDLKEVLNEIYPINNDLSSHKYINTF